MSFRRRLALSCGAAVAIVVVLGSVLAYLVVRGTLRAELDSALRRQVFGGPPMLPPGEVSGPVDQLMLLTGEAPAFVQSIRGTAPSAEKALPPPFDDDAEVQAVMRGEEPAFSGDREIEGAHVRVFVTRLPTGTTIFAARSLTEIDNALGRLRWGLGLLALAGIALAVLLSRLAMRTAVRPVAELTTTAEHVASTRDLTRRIDAHGEDEVSRLASAFNTMLEALERSQKAQRQLVADASHELRTPLTSLRTNMEVLARGGPPDVADREALRADLVAQLEELTGLVADLVELARDEEPCAPSIEDVRLDHFVAAAVARARRHSPAVCFETSLEPALVAGVPSRLDRAIGNLLDNAAKWSPPGGVVEVRIDDGELTVRDRGPGIPDEDRGQIFDRFYRADRARGRPGSGLGLAIVRQVAEFHGGTVVAEAAEGGGALLRLRLPVLSASS